MWLWSPVNMEGGGYPWVHSNTHVIIPPHTYMYTGPNPSPPLCPHHTHLSAILHPPALDQADAYNYYCTSWWAGRQPQTPGSLNGSVDGQSPDCWRCTCDNLREKVGGYGDISWKNTLIPWTPPTPLPLTPPAPATPTRRDLADSGRMPVVTHVGVRTLHKDAGRRDSSSRSSWLSTVGWLTIRDGLEVMGGGVCRGNVLVSKYVYISMRPCVCTHPLLSNETMCTYTLLTL